MSPEAYTSASVNATAQPRDMVSQAKGRCKEIQKLSKLCNRNFAVHHTALLGAIHATQLDLSDVIPALLEVEATPANLQETAQTITSLLRGYIRSVRKKPTFWGRVFLVCGSILVFTGGMLLAVVALSIIPLTAGSMLPVLAWVSRSPAIEGTRLFEILGLMTALGAAFIAAGIALYSKGKKTT